MKKLFFVLALAFLLVSSAFAVEGQKVKKEKYHSACENGKLVIYDDKENVSLLPTTNNSIDTTRQSVKEFNKIIRKCGKPPKHKKQK